MKKYFLALLALTILSCEEEIPVYTVTVSSSPSEGGSVSPQGGEYEQGQTASFTATPNEFYEFSGWSGADTSSINPVSIIVDTNKSLTARFEKLDTDNDGITDDIDQCPDTPANEQADSNGCSVSQKDFELTVSVEGEGTVTEEVVVAPTIYQGTTQVQLTAVPAEGWEFTEWTGNATGTDNPITIEIDGTKNITAVFTKKDTDGDGVPDLEDTCADTPEGEEADENGCSLSQKEFELTVTTEGEGTVTEELVVSPTIYQGTSQVKLTAVPAEGWELIEWTGDATGSENPITIEIDGAKSITAVFAKKDTDGDGVPDLEDLCEDTPSDEEADENGCSISQRDSDNDGVNDHIDQCPDTPEGEEADENGCALSQKDSDNDGVTDDIDECPGTEEGVEVDENGCRANPIYLDENGVTIKANEWAEIGKSYELNGVTYKLVDETMLFEMVSNDEDVTKIVTTRVTRMTQLFKDKTDFNQDISTWDVSNVTSDGFVNLFMEASSFNQDISEWDVSNGVDFGGMFSGASSFNQDISSWDMSGAIRTAWMFSGAHEFNKPLNDWDVSNVTDMKYMFQVARSFNQELNLWDVSSVEDMTGMFSFAFEFNQPLHNWDVSSVTSMGIMFNEATSFNQNLSTWNTSKVEDMAYMFKLSNYNGNISTWDVSSVTKMEAMFQANSVFNQDISSWDVSNVTNMDYLFDAATAFNQNISAWCVTNIASEPERFNNDGILENNNKPVWGTCPINPELVTAIKTGSGTSQSCTNGVCTTTYTLVTKIKNDSGKTITLNNIEIYFGSTYANSTSEQNGDIQDGGSKSVSWSYPSTNLNLGRPLIKFYWTYDGVEYITEYQD